MDSWLAVVWPHAPRGGPDRLPAGPSLRPPGPARGRGRVRDRPGHTRRRARGHPLGGHDLPAAGAALGVHSRDAMWAVDGLTDAVTSATQAAVTADRLAEDLEIFSSPQFGYVRLHPSLCRASALMPQKRNPYALAVIRGGAGTLIGRTAGILATQRTPSARTDNWLYAYGEVLGAVGLGQRLVALAGEVV